MRSPLLVAIGLLVGVAVLVAIDVTGDWDAGASPWHLGFELGAITLALAGAVGLGWRARREVQTLRTDLTAARQDLSVIRQEAERWRGEAQELLRGLGEAIDVQFERWELTPAEREVGLMLLKGLSLREIAQHRQTSERTARQQARAVYAKAGLANRSELAAFFLEDLLLPPERTDRTGAEPPAEDGRRR